MSCIIKVNKNMIEFTVNTSCYCVLDLLCVIYFKWPNPTITYTRSLRSLIVEKEAVCKKI